MTSNFTLVKASAGTGKCVKHDTTIFYENGMTTIGDLYEQQGEDESIKFETDITSFNGVNQKISKTSYIHKIKNTNKLINIKTNLGYEICGTPEHKVYVFNPEEIKPEFKKLSDISKKDIILLSRNQNQFAKEATNEEYVILLARLIGTAIGDGHFSSYNKKSFASEIIITKECKIFRKKLAIICNKLNIEFKEKKYGNRATSFILKDMTFITRMYGIISNISGDKEFPDFVKNGSKKVVSAFISALFDTDGGFNKCDIEWCSKSKILANQVHLSLLNFGIISRMTEKIVNNVVYYRIFISSKNLITFEKEIGFYLNDEKKEKLRKYIKEKSNFINVNIDCIKPYQKLNKEHFKGDCNTAWGYYSGRRKLTEKSINNLIKLPNHDEELFTYKKLIETFYFDEIKSISDDFEEYVYDFTVPENHSFVANGFINHNTYHMVNNIQELIKLGIEPEKILAFTFTNYATNELKTRLKEHSNKITIGTMHSVFRNILFDLLKNTAKKNNQSYIQPTLMTDLDIEIALKGLVKKYYKLSCENIKDTILEISNKINQIYIPSRRYDDLNKLMCDFDEYKNRNNLITFDDMLYKTYFLLKGNKEYLDKWSKRWEYIFVDEFQDSNLLQVELLKQLSSHNKHLFAIGDYKQSIYGFRGGDPSLMINFDTYFNNPEISTLSKTYRNSIKVLDLANKVTDKFFSKYDETLVETNSEEEGSVTIKEFNSSRKETEFIVRNLEEDSNTMVLTRNNAQLIDIELELIKNNKRYTILGDLYFYKNKHILNLLNLALIIQHPNKVATKCYASSLKWFAPYMKRSTKQEILRENITLKRLSEITPSEHSDLKYFTMFVDKIKYCLKFIKEPAGNVLNIAYSVMNYEKYIKSSENKMQASDSISIVNKFIELTKSFKSLDELFIFINSAKKADHESKIILSTIHKSKGLEADNVIIAGMNKGIFPHVIKTKEEILEDDRFFIDEVFGDERIDDEKYEEEEERLLYVAITRARTNLTITSILPSKFFKIIKEIA